VSGLEQFDAKTYFFFIIHAQDNTSKPLQSIQRLELSIAKSVLFLMFKHHLLIHFRNQTSNNNTCYLDRHRQAITPGNPT
jgi:hypothetical protein